MAKDWGWWGIAGVGMQSPSIVVVVLILFYWVLFVCLVVYLFYFVCFVLYSLCLLVGFLSNSCEVVFVFGKSISSVTWGMKQVGG